MAVRITLHDEEFNRNFRKATAAGIQRAGVFLHSACIRETNKSNVHRHTAKFTASQRAGRGGQKTGVVYENMHNAYAGQPPFKRTGVGQSNIVYEYNDNDRAPAVRVGVRENALYMLFLEVGTGRVMPRPWLLATLRKNMAMLARLACTGGTSK